MKTQNVGNVGRPSKVAAFRQAKQQRNAKAMNIESEVGKPKVRAYKGISENTKAK